MSLTTQLTMAYAVVVTWLAVAGWRMARSATRVGWSREQLLCLGGITAAFLAWTATVPHAPWQTNFHGFGRVPGVENAHWWSPLGQGGVHGVGWIATMRVLAGLTGGAVSVFMLNVLVACGGLWAGAVWVARWARDPSAGLGFAAMLASAPVWVRLAPSVSPYVLVTTVFLVALAAQQAFAEDGDASDLLVCALSWVLLADLHAELLLLAPAILATHGMVERAPWRRGILWGAVTLAAAFYAYRAGLAASWLSSELGAQGTVASRAMDLAGAPARWPVTQAVAVVTAWWLLRGALWDRDADLPEHAWRGLLGAAAVGWLALLWGVPVGYDPDLPPSAGPLSAYAYLQPWWHLGYAPPHGLIAVGIGALVLGWRAPARAWWLVSAVAISTGFYAGRLDAFATWVRTSSLSTALLASLGGVGVAAAHQVVTRAGGHPRAVAAALALWIGAGSWPYLSWTQYRFPMQQEHALLERVRELAGDGPVSSLGFEDVSAVVDPTRDDVAFRRYVNEFLEGSGVDVVGLREATDGGPEPQWYLRGLGCYRAILPRAGPSSGDKTLVVGDARWWLPKRGEGAVAPLDVSWRDVHRSDRRWDLPRLMPCWSSSEDRTCRSQAEDGTCAAWTCRDVERGVTEETYVDPACAAFERAWVLEEVYGEPVAGGQTSQASSTIVSDGARIALFRVLRRRE